MIQLTRRIDSILFGALLLAQAACGGGDDHPAVPPPPSATPVAEVKPPPSEASATPSAAPAAPPPVHWSYSGDTGPEHWGDLSPDFKDCKDGKSQSPIDLISKSPVNKKLAAIAFSYKPIPLQIINNGHTVQVNNTIEAYITIGAERYELVQLHFHSPSEHTVDGKAAGMELHLVHKNQGGSLAVIGLMLKKGKENAGLKPIWDNMPMAETEKDQAVSGASVDLSKVLPKKVGYSTYPGSLTAPKCTEGVSWFVLTETGEVSEAQITKFQSATHGPTSRPVQPLNGRKPEQFKP